MTREKYIEIFEKERRVDYPMIDEIEIECEYEVDREWLEACAFSLACPLKANPPNWQHGRVIYALVRKILDTAERGILLDVGTAKGFSACVMAKALSDTSDDVMGFNWVNFQIVSTDVVHPNARIKRNSVDELEELKTVGEFVVPFMPNTSDVSFRGDGSIGTLHAITRKADTRIPFAFLDGKHTYDVVQWEFNAVSRCQEKGDIVLFDDAQIPGVFRAIQRVDRGQYAVRVVDILPNRSYAIAERR